MGNRYHGYTYKGEVTLRKENITADVEAHARGFYFAGSSFGYGTEPPDGDFEITSVTVNRAWNTDTEEEVEVTKELKTKIESALYDEEFEED